MDNSRAWDQYARYYDAATEGLVQDLNFYQHQAHPHEKILEAGCGTGRVLKALVARGHHCTGIDASSPMLGHARINLASWLHGTGLELVHRDLCSGPVHSGATLGLVTRQTLASTGPRADRFLQNLSESLFLHHRIIIHCSVPRTIQAPELEGVWQQGVMTVRGKKITWREMSVLKKDMETRTLVLDTPEGEEKVEFHLQWFRPEDIQALLRAAGYTDLTWCQPWTGLWTDSSNGLGTRSDYLVMAIK